MNNLPSAKYKQTSDDIQSKIIKLRSEQRKI